MAIEKPGPRDKSRQSTPKGQTPSSIPAVSGGELPWSFGDGAGTTGDERFPHIPGYQIIGPLGHGGMGVVWKAVEVSTKRKVAIKLMNPTLFGSDKARIRFTSEVELAAKLDHPNIARVYESKLTSAPYYYAMEYVDGWDLTTFVERNKLSERQIVALMRRVCRAVQHAHQRAVIHRDLKPSNILVTRDGQPKVLDFGLARMLEDQDSQLSIDGDITGTPAYMSPEQAQGKVDEIDTRSDLFSLGVILFVLLTKHNPHDTKGGYSAIITRVANEEVRTPAGVGANVEPDLCAILAKALAKDAPERYESVEAFSADLTRYLEGNAVLARAPTLSYVLRKQVFKHKEKVALTGSIMGLLLCIGVLSYFRVVDERNRADQQATAAKTAAENEHKTRTALEAREQAIIDARDVAAREADNAKKAQATATRETDNAKKAQATAASAERQAIMNLADTFTARGLEAEPVNGAAALWFAQAAITAKDDPARVESNLVRVNNWSFGQWQPVAAVEHPGSDQLSFDPENSRYLITGSLNGKSGGFWRLWDLATEKSLKLPAGFDEPISAVWVTGGRVLLGTQTGQVALLSIPDLRIIRQWEAGSEIKRVTASADGQLVGAITGSKLIVWPVLGNSRPATVERSTEISYAAFAPAGRFLVISSGETQKTDVFSAETDGTGGIFLRHTMGPVTHIYRRNGLTRVPVFTKLGDELMIIDDGGTRDRPGTIKWYDSRSGRELGVSNDGWLWTATKVAVSDDGIWLAIGVGEGSLYNTNERKYIRSLRGNTPLTFNPDGNQIAMLSDQGIEVKSFTKGNIGSTAFPVINRRGVAAFSNDGKYLASLWNGVAQIWRLPIEQTDVPTERNIALDGRSSWAAFSPDGQYVTAIGILDGGAEVRAIQVFQSSTTFHVGNDLRLDGRLLSAAFSPDGRLIASLTGMGNDKRQLHFWDWKKGTEVIPPLSFESEPVWVAYARDGKAVAVHCVDGKVVVVDPTNGHALLNIQCGAARGTGIYPWRSGRGTICFSHDGRTLFTWGSSLVQAWDRTTGTERYALKLSGTCWCLDESADGRTLAIGDDAGTLRFVNTASGKETIPPITHPDAIYNVAFSPDGKLACTSCGDTQVRVWEVSTGTLRFTISTANSLEGAMFTRDGRYIVTTAYGNFQVWDAQTGYAVSHTHATHTDWHEQSDISNDGHWLATGGASNSLCISDLHFITTVSEKAPEDALLWSELLSNSRVNGATIVSLTNAEWLDRWRRYRLRHPGSLIVDPGSLPTPAP